MTAATTERRSSKRFTVEVDRAEVQVEFNGLQHRAVMAEMSATGFGLLLLKGFRVAPGDSIRLREPGSKTVYDLEVVHVRPEDGFQYVGLRQLSDATPYSIPLFRIGAKTYRLPIPSFSPLLYVAVVLGFSGTSITLIELMSGGFGPVKQTPNTAHEQALIDASNRMTLAEKRQRLLERVKSRATSSGSGRSGIDITPGFWERITGPSREQVGRLLGRSSFSWSELVSQLGLSPTQQERIQGLIHDNDSEKGQSARSEMVKLLTDEQRSAFNQMLATFP